MTSTTLDNLPDFPNLPGAVCAQVDPELFYPEVGESTADAIAVCNICPVRQACLAWALDRREFFGVWGGTSGRMRRKMLGQAIEAPDLEPQLPTFAEAVATLTRPRADLVTAS